MAIVDAEGRVFGRWNLLDALVAVFVVGLIPLAYGAYALFRAPAAQLAAVEPAKVLGTGNYQVTVRGINLRPYMRVSFGDHQGRTYKFMDPTRADIDVDAIEPGSYDVILYDHAQERSRLVQAFTVEAPAKATVEVDLLGMVTNVPAATIGRLTAGSDLPGLGQIQRVGKASPSVTKVTMGAGRLFELPVSGSVSLPMVVRAKCELVAKNGFAICVALGVNLMPDVIVQVPSSVGTVFFQVDQIRTVANPRQLEVRVRLVGDRESLARLRVGDREDQSFAAIAPVPSVAAAAETIPAQSGVSVSINVNAQGSIDPILAAGNVATRDVTLLVPGEETAGRWSYAGRDLQVGGQLTFKTQDYALRGSVLSVGPAR
ncbi:MAG: DUF4330 family protein [Vicinamibacterales bacterium]